MTESERERLTVIFHAMIDSVASPGWVEGPLTPKRKLFDLINKALAIAAMPATPATPGFALVGPEGRVIYETVCALLGNTQFHATEHAWQALPEDDYPQSARRSDQLAWLATHNYHIRPVEIRVVPEPEGQERPQ